MKIVSVVRNGPFPQNNIKNKYFGAWSMHVPVRDGMIPAPSISSPLTVLSITLVVGGKPKVNRQPITSQMLLIE